MSSPSSRLSQHRRRILTPTEDQLGGIMQPTPPPGGKRPTSSSSSRPESGSSSRRDSISSRSSIPEVPRISRQNSVLSPFSNEINYDMLPEASKGVTTIGRHHTIVPPINKQGTDLRPISSRSHSIMAEASITLNLSGSDEYNPDDHAINSISEENDPTGSTPRLHNPLVNPQYIERPQTVLNNNNNNNNTYNIPKASTPLPEEPIEDEPRLRLAVKLRDGSRIDRYFRPADKLKTVLVFAGKHCETSLESYTLRSADAKYSDMDKTLAQSEIVDRTLLLLVPPDS